MFMCGREVGGVRDPGVLGTGCWVRPTGARRAEPPAPLRAPAPGDWLCEQSSGAKGGCFVFRAQNAVGKVERKGLQVLSESLVYLQSIQGQERGAFVLAATSDTQME